MNFWTFEYQNPEFFWLLAIIPLMLFWYFWKLQNKHPQSILPSLSPFSKTTKSWKENLRHLLIFMRLIAIASLIIAIARPYNKLDKSEITTEGIDIVIALDISSSMLSKDFTPNRLEAAKDVAIEFIKDRPNDRIGLVVFSGESFTQCPITTDHKVLIRLINELESGIIKPGTAIGMGLATASDRLKNSGGISKVVILLTDGENNRGNIDPVTAAEIAKAFKIRVYTIGVGSVGKALSPVAKYANGQYRYEYVDVNIDEKTLKEIASLTGTQYFRATDNLKLREIYSEIDQMEKAKIEVTSISRFTDKFYPFAILALILIGLEIIFRNTIFRTYP